MILDNKLFADEKFQSTITSLGLHDTLAMPPTGGVMGFPDKFTLDTGITFRYFATPSAFFKDEEEAFMCHAQLGLNKSPNQPKDRGTELNLAFYDKVAMWCYIARSGPNYDDDLLDKMGQNRGAQPWKVELTALDAEWGETAAGRKAYEKSRPIKCKAKCWLRSKHTCDDEGCFLDIITEKCMTRDSCAVMSKVKNENGKRGETCSGKYLERNLVPPPPPMKLGDQSSPGDDRSSPDTFSPGG